MQEAEGRTVFDKLACPSGGTLQRDYLDSPFPTSAADLQSHELGLMDVKELAI